MRDILLAACLVAGLFGGMGYVADSYWFHSRQIAYQRNVAAEKARQAREACSLAQEEARRAGAVIVGGGRP